MRQRRFGSRCGRTPPVKNPRTGSGLDFPLFGSRRVIWAADRRSAGQKANQAFGFSDDRVGDSGCPVRTVTQDGIDLGRVREEAMGFL